AQLLGDQVVADGLADQEVWLRGPLLGVHVVSATYHLSLNRRESRGMLLAVSALTLMRTLVFCAVAVVCASPAWADHLPDIKSRSAVVLDAATGEELFVTAADEIRPIASTTKIFVAMAVRRRIDLDGWTEITKVDAYHARGGSRTRLSIGHKILYNTL